MKLVGTIARILLGLLFLIFGLNGFLLFMPAPPLGGTAGAFSGAMFSSHFMYFTSGVQVLCGVLLLLNRYVIFAIVVLAAVLANILAFHITMLPEGLPMALIVTGLWFLAALPLRAQFAPLFRAKA